MIPQYRTELIIELMAFWAMDYRSRGCHDEDVVVAGIGMTVGQLRRAFERYFRMPFSTYQTRAPVSFGPWVEGDDRISGKERRA